MKMKYLLIAAACLVFVNLQAQKFGYVNSQALLIESPEVKAADAELSSYQQELLAQGEQKVKSFETKYKSYVEAANAGTLSQIEMQQQEGELAQEQEAIRQFEVEIQQKLLTKREALYNPILDKMKNALDAIGKENGYTMIFDSSLGGLLHATEADDLMPMLKAKLGM